MNDADLSQTPGALDVSRPASQSRIQIGEVKLVSSALNPLGDENHEEQSRFVFRIEAFVKRGFAISSLETQVTVVNPVESGEKTGWALRFTLLASFVAEQEMDSAQMAEFTRMYTLSILWPYAREYVSDQFRRTGDAFDALPIINPQVVTESLISADLVQIHTLAEDAAA